MLESLEYRVYAVGSGQDAVDIYRERNQKIALVILDMIMSGMSGSGAFDQLRGINPR
jgi:CheY-like chemotaxis protein